MRLPLDESKTSALETADYIALLARELRGLAARADLGFLAYLLAMVEDDAQSTIRKLRERTSVDG